MKKLLIAILLLLSFLSNNLLAYDAVIKDEYGRVTGYLDQNDDKTYMVDKYRTS